MDKSKYRRKRQTRLTLTNTSGMTLPELVLRPLLLAGLGYAGCFENVGVDVLFCDEDTIRGLNLRHRAQNKATDVLSFPQFDRHETVPRSRAGSAVPVHLGDIALCPQVAAAQADLYGHDFAHELRFLFVHGLLHLLGYDHENEADETVMRQAQRDVMQRA